jgi:radical SAM superfamily enzyme YgiQ (UPF0313 family)
MLQRVLFVQLSIPPLGPGIVRANVPLAGAYLKMYAQRRGLDAHYDLEVFPAVLANQLSDLALLDAILSREPWMVGFTCYLWNIERTLWLAERLKRAVPGLHVVVGGPEITSNNDWVLQHPAVDFAVIGEGEQTFADLLTHLHQQRTISTQIPGLLVKDRLAAPSNRLALSLANATDSCSSPQNSNFIPRKPLAKLDEISSPYLVGILDAADEEMLLLETIRGCTFKCKFCYYPKSYDGLYFLSEEKIIANLRHALDRGAKEVVLLDPTLNQRRDFDGFLKLLIQHNAHRQLTFFGELRAEGIKETTARLLAEAGFTEVEVGLQSIDPDAMRLMDRKNNLHAIERGCKAMLAAGIRVKVDLIIGLPGDTVDSIRRSMHYLRDAGISSDVQVFNLAILPGTAFRQEAAELGLVHQPRPPYYVRRTPTLGQDDLFDMMREAADIFEMEWDPLPEPVLPQPGGLILPGQSFRLTDHALLNFARPDEDLHLPPPGQRSQAFTLWFRSRDFSRDAEQACRWIERLFEETPFTTLQVLLEPLGDPRSITPEVLELLWGACQRQPTYLDRYYAMQPGRPLGAKRIVVLLKGTFTESVESWECSIADYADVLSSAPRRGAATLAVPCD